MRRISLLLGATLCFMSYTNAQEVKEKEVKRIVSTLAADDMEGRAPGTPGIEKAAAFISKEFASANLLPLPGESSYLQKFNKYFLSTTSHLLKINGESKDWIVMPIGNNPDINWTIDGSYTIVHVKDRRDLIKALRSGTPEKNTLVLIDSSLTEFVSAIHGHFSEKVFDTKEALESAVEKAKSGSQIVAVLEQSPIADDAKIEINIKRTISVKPYENVGGMIKGRSKPNEYVVFSGHYDHLGILPPVNGDAIANGADDDASGTTAVIMLAKYFSKLKPERSVIFVAFTAEESGGYGSTYFSENLDPDKVIAMFNIEMIGKESKFGKNSAFITGFDRSDFGPILQRNLKGSVFNFYPDPYPEQDLFYRSDNATLARKGVPAHTISTTQIDKDQYYHTVDDEVETLDIKNITSIIKAIAASSTSIVNGTETPTRIEKESLKK
ncbi:M20/M25/M40 family metallo-hydrolase [Chitinophaga silvatica]|uniref:M20/M25/M40 family metallo-hydrolase n=1 Tax=Chitinophaga silvatica TaxID=2282649 RepID=A0A3E1Y2Z5_9BACT|nr:M20/M25/M40 family metallo-hydrolase [Chitinophaga silvatica]RFS19033.1 M20/M25/M40 family metallo-hydrolase [Chitinophaga silvatica]